MGQVIEKPRTEPSPSMQFRDQLTRMNADISTALPPHIPVERFTRVVLTAVNGNPDLLDADRRSLFEAAMKAAQDGLLPDGRDGAFVTFNTKLKDGRNRPILKDGKEQWVSKVQWLPMVGGILKKVRNSGDLLSIAAHVVYEKDRFEYVLGDDERIEHSPALSDRGKPIAVYAIAKTKDGGIYRDVMSIADVEKVRNVSRAKDSGPWKDWWDEMAKKTVIRRLAKRLPMSSDLDDLIRQDDELYDFKGHRAEKPEPAFTVIDNPLSDEVPPKMIEAAHEPSDEEQDNTPVAPLSGVEFITTYDAELTVCTTATDHATVVNKYAGTVAALPAAQRKTANSMAARHLERIADA